MAMMAGYGNWQIGKDLPDRMLYMLKNNLMCDVTLLLGPDRTPVKAHKYMLASASPVFYSMFEGPIAEKGDVAIPDIEPDVFKILLRFVYSGKTRYIDGEYIHGLIYAADKYMLDGLKEECLTSFDIGYDSDKNLDYDDSISDVSDVDSDDSVVTDISDLDSEIDDSREPYKPFSEYVFQHLQTADAFGIEHIKSKCIKYICQNGNQCFVHKDFNIISEECLSVVLKSDLLNCNEKTVYESVIGWAKNQCSLKKIRPYYKNIRNVLGNIIYHIRFPLMDRKYFSKNVEKKGILNKEETKELYYFFVAKYPLNLFNKTPRGRAPFTTRICDIEGEEVMNWVDDYKDCLDLFTNCDAQLHGVLIFKPKFRWEKGTFCLEVRQTKYDPSGADVGKTLTTTYSIVRFDYDERIQYCELEEKVDIEKNRKCTLTLIMIEDGVTFFTGRDYRSEVVENEVVVTFKRSKSDEPYKGQIAGIRLSNSNI